MLKIIGSSLLSLLWGILGNTPQQQVQLESIAWHDTALFQLPDDRSDPVVQQIVDDYLQNLSQQGIKGNLQGVWLQSDWLELGEHQGNIPVSAASLTKIATTLAALGKLGVEHQFITRISHTGSIQGGVLQGDLIIEGNQDPFFVWEEAIALSNSLNQLGIKEITGNLLVNDQFYMNYQSDPEASGKLLKQGLEPGLWSSEVKQQFRALPIITPRPQLTIKGKVKVIENLPRDAQLLVLHKSLSLMNILRQMNIYSNNQMAQMLADTVGGASEVANYALEITGVSPSEIQLINGSGLGVENRISPRAATKMLMAIENLLQPHNLQVVDILPVAGRDSVGTMENRDIPQGVAVKTGTLNQVSALAGVIPLDSERKIWFAVINSGWQIKTFRQQQDKLLKELVNHWQLTPIINNQSFSETQVYLGDPQRNQIQ
ncbi:D-alanyl-D-alanine carboxypeptidase (Penicillin-binding protein 4) [Hyella patelloides LEGE 07179]|uniref:D-alanyl-D-alanine carboxypeptidase (Penicillin-binding protein 4) n=1 Tax=Hyella patelloides LEGE 07179 TaxID=945734 RepID=A0A563VT59_9CYAN|nr:D-alanyl-D-alanine carboxypeptidase [Hyella patelloides]VEP14569.1 D-alanyl-D-alanine carboxypeptidase (Penicillin-binding protein 4) [Hyella patelloides LEGE 07179]